VDPLQTLAPLPDGRFAGPRAFAELIRQALQAASHQGWSHLLLSDPDFADWPLGERLVVDAFNQWAARGRTLHVLARQFDTLRQQHPRFVQWRGTWDHLVTARAWRRAAEGELPSAFWSPAWALERLDVTHSRGVCGHDAGWRTALHERIDSVWHRASPSFAVTTLGL